MGRIDQIESNRPNWTVVDQMDRIGLEWTEVNEID